MSLGISIEKTIKNQPGLVKFMIVGFALATPFGVLLGILISEANIIVKIIFLSLSVGTFTYISCSEVIIEEFSVPKFR